MSVAGLSLTITGESAGAVSALGSVDSALDKTQGKVKDTGTKTSLSMGQTVTAISGVATGAFGLYMAFDRVQDMTLQVDKANLVVRTSTEAVEKAQAALNTAVEKYRVDSPEAVQAADNLAIAQDRLKLAQDRAANAQESQQQGMMGFALTVVPSVISMVGSLIPLLGAQAGATVGATGAMHGLNLAFFTSPIGIIVLAIVALVAILIVAYNTCEPFRNAINAIGSAIRDFVMPIWDRFLGIINSVWGAIKGFWDWINGIWSGITNFFGGLLGGGQTASSASSGTVNYSGVPTEPYQSAMYNPIMFTRTTSIIAHRGEVIGEPEVILARSGAHAGGVTFVTNITGNTISSDVDLEEILDRRDRLLFSKLGNRGLLYPR